MVNNMRVWSFLLLSLVTSSSSEKLSFDYMFQFGDSYTDTGNLLRENPTFGSLYGRFPYGKTIHHPTGRCSDGLLVIDFFAEFFHPPLLKPYLENECNFETGVNFATAGSTALNMSVLKGYDIFSPVTNTSLSVQLHWFKSYLDSTCKTIPECKQIVSNSLIIMGEIGGNDYNYAILEGKTMEDLSKMVPQVVESIKEAAKEVVNLGAVRVVVPGNFPIGCLPIYLTVFETEDPGLYDELGCLKYLNDFSKLHNDRVKEAIKELREEFPHVAIAYGDYFSALRWILRHAPSLGFNKDAQHRTCCGSGDNKYNFDLTRMCGYKGVPVCANPNQQISWDGIHLTQHAYQHMAQWLLQRIVPVILRVV